MMMDVSEPLLTRPLPSLLALRIPGARGPPLRPARPRGRPMAVSQRRDPHPRPCTSAEVDFYCCRHLCNAPAAGWRRRCQTLACLPLGVGLPRAPPQLRARYIPFHSLATHRCVPPLARPASDEITDQNMPFTRLTKQPARCRMVTRTELRLSPHTRPGPAPCTLYPSSSHARALLRGRPVKAYF